MRVILGLFLLSLFLTTGTSLKCESCVGVGMNCSGKKETCEAGLDTCGTLFTEVTKGGVTGKSVVKSCFPKSFCTTGPPKVEVPDTIVTTKIECYNNAPPAAASFLPSLFGLVLVKLLL